MATTQPATSHRPTREEHPVVLFDGVCNLCNRSVRHIIRNDPRGRFRFASLQSEAGRALLEEHGLEPQHPVGHPPEADSPDPSTVVLIENGKLYTKSDAALRILRRLRGSSRYWYAARFIPRPLRDAAYDFIARNRYRWFGRRDECMVPTPELQPRFLDAGES